MKRKKHNRKQTVRKVWYMRMWIYIVFVTIVLLVLYFIMQGIRCNRAVNNSRERLISYGAVTAKLSYGNMTYVDSLSNDDKSDEPVILSIHGIFGGYDQAYDTCKDFASRYRIIAPSRFGYLESDVMEHGTPGNQATAYVELLDHFGIDQVYLLATSAGGTAAIRFALDYPQRTKGLILYCSAMPRLEKSDTYPEYLGPPSFICNNYAMYLIHPLFEPIMGMEPSTIYSMMPIDERSLGVELDASINNIDMLKNYDDYPIEDLQVPTLIFHAKDDKMASYSDTEKALPRFPNTTFISFETGGHLMKGHGEEIQAALTSFINAQEVVNVP